MFEQITSRSQVLTKEEREALRQAYQRKKEEETVRNKINSSHARDCFSLPVTLTPVLCLIQKAAEDRKLQIYEADLTRKKNPALTELEIEARDRAQRLLERANALRMEQEEEIKKLNKVGSCIADTQKFYNVRVESFHFVCVCAPPS